MKKTIILLSTILCLLSSCVQENKVEVLASFVTDKDVYGLGEKIQITNTSTVKNSIIAICKWEYNNETSYDYELEGLSFLKEGKYTITLTITANDDAVKGVFSKTISVIDNNVLPVADFTWSPETIKAGDLVRFTDKSTDSDGEIVSWEWKIGSGTSTEQNPSYEFVEYGEVEVSLTVTDNMYGKSTKSVIVNVEKGKYTLDLKWLKPYEGTSGAFTRFTSPSMSPDGQYIYVTSSGGKLVKFNTDGEEQWSYDYAAVHGTVYLNQCGDKNVCVSTPSVDQDGTIYFAAGYNEPQAEPANQGILALNADGTLKWYAQDGVKTRYAWHSPVILDGYIATAQTHGTKGLVSNDQACTIVDKNDGSRLQTIYATSGSNGGISAYKGRIFIHAAGKNSNTGTNVGFLTGENEWSLVNNSETNKQDKFWPGYGYCGRGCQHAISKEGLIYFLYPKDLNNPQAGGILFCYDNNDIRHETEAAPAVKWILDIPGYLSSTPTSTSTEATNIGGHGTALSSDGIAYVTTRTTLTAVDKNGVILWAKTADGTIECVPAVDDAGFIYYCDSGTGNIVKMSPDGTKVAALDLKASLRSSPTISADGTIYVIGVKDGFPTLFSIGTNDINGPADNWSQLSCNPSKTSHMK